MSRTAPTLWFTLILLLLLPTAAGRFLLDIAGGLLILTILMPILLAGAGWIGWKLIQSKIVTCNNCGNSFLNNLVACPICGSTEFQVKSNTFNSSNNSTPASKTTIDIKAEKTE